MVFNCGNLKFDLFYIRTFNLHYNSKRNRKPNAHFYVSMVVKDTSKLNVATYASVAAPRTIHKQSVQSMTLVYNSPSPRHSQIGDLVSLNVLYIFTFQIDIRLEYSLRFSLSLLLLRQIICSDN